MHAATCSVKGDVLAGDVGCVEVKDGVQTWMSLSASMQSLGLSSPSLYINLKSSMFFRGRCLSSGIAWSKIVFTALKQYVSSWSSSSRRWAKLNVVSICTYREAR
jgi:hypothetical protein